MTFAVAWVLNNENDRESTSLPTHLWAHSGTLRGNSENSDQSYGNSSRDGLGVQPEGDPGQSDDEHTRDVGLGHVESDLTMEKQPRLQAREGAW